MKKRIKRFLGQRTTKAIGIIRYRCIDILLAPLTIVSAYYFRFLRNRRFNLMPISKKILFSIGVLPIVEHYYEPMFDHRKNLRYPLTKKRYLPGIDLNINNQIDLLRRFKFNDELVKIDLDYDKQNYFSSADAELFYNIIRYFKPKRIIEIGGGYSTVMAIKAITENKNEKYYCEYTCIEPFENPWLDKLNIHIHREKVENCDLTIFKELQENDIVFIDSSHVIRPQGDVLFEFLEILPILNDGVLIHVHDIYTPQDYPQEVVFWGDRLWNEQYLLEAFLSCNSDFSVLVSNNYLLNHHYQDLALVSPATTRMISENKKVGAGSFWIRKQKKIG
jgi:hypothetical protein